MTRRGTAERGRRTLQVGFYLGLVLGGVGCDGGGDGGSGPPPREDGGLDVAFDDMATGGVDGSVLGAACGNGADDDGDGLVDFPADPGCTAADDDDEADPVRVLACANDLDDDGDGAIDLADPGCARAQDDDESDDPAPPQCANLADDDADGYTDFPSDPGCGSEFDDDETNTGNQLPQCSDGTDNDRDGLVDIADPGCASPADPREAEMPEAVVPVCSNGLDDDGDGVVDFPLEPGCAAAGDDDEADGPAPACANASDDDDDGRVDYPDDPGCAGVGDRDETDPEVPSACADDFDNDRDGQTDYPADRGCQSAADASEAGSCGVGVDPVELSPDVTVFADTRGGRFESEGSCGGRGAAEIVYVYRVERTLEALELSTAHPETGVETTIYVRRACLNGDTEVACALEPLDDGVAANTLRVEQPPPGDYYIYVDGATGRGGAYALTATEVPLAACLNRADDDDDGRVDYPFDPGCERPSDRDESDPEVPSVCANDDDDDGDGLVDYPLDLGCESAGDRDEVDLCGQGIRFTEFPEGETTVLGDTSQGVHQFRGSCSAGTGQETVVRYRNAFNARLTFSVDYPETVESTHLYVRRECGNAASEVANGCSTGLPPASRGRVRLDRSGPGDYFVVVDHPFGPGGAFKLTVDVERLPPGCSDGADGDGDTLVDGDDRGCESAADEDETDPPAGAPAPVCDNGADDDADGVADYPFDVGCATKGDQDETDPVDAMPACNNGLDDDDDGRTDFPIDPGCQARGDDSERNPVPPPQCGDNVDQDMDGLTDYPFDPGCDAAGDPSERDPAVRPTCANLADDDRDGLVDFPVDPGCDAAADRDEADPAIPQICRNGMDDDGDGITDFPRDPGCRYAADPDETDPGFAPQCANRRDDDADMRVDFPDDPGCANAADNDEVNVGRPPERCRDGIDNDDDGSVDLSDVGCVNGRDNDEADPAAGVVPFCANAVDDDGDGAVDWPDDDGCAAQGAECEQAGYGLCEGACLDLVNDEANCGRCGRACDPGIECIEGACGGLYVFEGIAQNLDEAELNGWEQCHRDLYTDSAVPVANLSANCQGEFVMLACRQIGSPTFRLAAMGERALVFTNTGDRNNNVTTTNGASFYFSESYSIGFVAEGSVPSRNSCDTGNERGELRMCWHTNGGRMSSGYRCGNDFLNGNAQWERLIFTSR